MQNLPIGKSDFRSLRQGNFYFVDKSEFIAEIINEHADVLLITRPRRFGKTLNLSMLRYFFGINEDCRDIFRGLKIEELPEFEHQGKYPVIFLTFKDLKEPSFEIFLQKMAILICDVYEEHKQTLLALDKTRTEEKDIQRILSRDTDYVLLSESLKNLTRYLSRAYDRKPILLLDEYDTPIHAGWIKGYYEEVIDFMRGFLSGALKDDPHVFKVVLIGCLRVAKESVFTGGNNLRVAGILSRRLASYFGFTPEECAKLLADYEMADKYEEVMDWYNGYKIGDRTLLNPWSVINYIAEGEPLPYWANTSANDLIKKLIREGSLSFKNNIYSLLEGEQIESVIH